jgi:predicted DNA-binding ribbon-helix-helix protein
LHSLTAGTVPRSTSLPDQFGGNINSSGVTTMKSPIIKRSVMLDGHKTSVSMEDLFWLSLKNVAVERAMPLSKLIESINAGRGAGTNLSSAIRVYLLDRFRTELRDLETGRSSVRLAVSPLEGGLR